MKYCKAIIISKIESTKETKETNDTIKTHLICTNQNPQECDSDLGYKTGMKRAQSSKPLRISLKDLEWVKKLKEKMLK